MATIQGLNYKTSVFTGTARQQGAGEALANLVVGSIKLKGEFDKVKKSKTEEQDRILLYEQQAKWGQRQIDTGYHTADGTKKQQIYNDFFNGDGAVEFSSDFYKNYALAHNNKIAGSIEEQIGKENKIRITNHYNEALQMTPDMSEDMFNAIMEGAKADGVEMKQVAARKKVFEGIESAITANPEQYKGMTKSQLYEAFPVLKSTMDKNIIPKSTSNMINKIDADTQSDLVLGKQTKDVAGGKYRVFDIKGTEEHRKKVGNAALRSISQIRDTSERSQALGSFALNNPRYAKTEIDRLSNNFLRGEVTNESASEIQTLINMGVPLSDKVQEKMRNISMYARMNGGDINTHGGVANERYQLFEQEWEKLTKDEKDKITLEAKKEVEDAADTGFWGDFLDNANPFTSLKRIADTFVNNPIRDYFAATTGSKSSRQIRKEQNALRTALPENRSLISQEAIKYKVMRPELSTDEAIEFATQDYLKTFGSGRTGTNSIEETSVHSQEEVSKYTDGLSGMQKDDLYNEVLLEKYNFTDKDDLSIVHKNINGKIYSTILGNDGEIMMQTTGVPDGDAKVHIVEQAKRKQKEREDREKAHWDRVRGLIKKSRETYDDKNKKPTVFNTDDLPKEVTAGIDPFDAIRKARDFDPKTIKQTFSKSLDAVGSAITQNFKSLDKVSGELFDTATKSVSENLNDLTKWFNGEISEIEGMSDKGKVFLRERYSGLKDQIDNLKEAYKEFTTEEPVVDIQNDNDFGGVDDEAGLFDKTFDLIVGSIDERGKGTTDTNTYKGLFAKSIINSLLPDMLSKKEYTNSDFSNKFLGKLNTVAEKYGSDLKVGESIIVNPDMASRAFGKKGYGYGGGNIQRDTGDKEIDLMRKGLGNFTLRKTEDGFEVYDIYDFKKGTHKHLKGRSELFVTAHKLGEEFLAEGSEDAIAINIKLPKRG